MSSPLSTLSLDQRAIARQGVTSQLNPDTNYDAQRLKGGWSNLCVSARRNSIHRFFQLEIAKDLEGTRSFEFPSKFYHALPCRVDEGISICVKIWMKSNLFEVPILQLTADSTIESGRENEANPLAHKFFPSRLQRNLFTVERLCAVEAKQANDEKFSHPPTPSPQQRGLSESWLLGFGTH